MHDHHQVGRTLGDGHTDVAHIGRQARLRYGDSILHLYLRNIEIGADVETDGDRKTAIAGRVRRQIDHVFDAVDLLFDRRDHGSGNDIGVGAGILPGHGDGGRRDLRILRDRQAGERHTAEDHENDRHHRSKDRAIDEKVRNSHALTPPVILTVAAGLPPTPVPQA